MASSSSRSGRKAPYRGSWARVARAVVASSPVCAWCSATSDLVCDHLVPGKPQFGLRTLCRSCNSRRSHGYTGPKGSDPRGAA